MKFFTGIIEGDPKTCAGELCDVASGCRLGILPDRGAAQATARLRHGSLGKDRARESLEGVRRYRQRQVTIRYPLAFT